MIAILILELRTPIPPKISTDPAEMDQAVWQPWEESAIVAMIEQGNSAATKIGCRVIGRRRVAIENRQDYPIGRRLLAEFMLELIE